MIEASVVQNENVVTAEVILTPSTSILANVTSVERIVEAVYSTGGSSNTVHQMLFIQEDYPGDLEYAYKWIQTYPNGDTTSWVYIPG